MLWKVHSKDSPGGRAYVGGTRSLRFSYTTLLDSTLSVVLAGASLIGAPGAQAAVAGGADYVCATPLGNVTVPVSVAGEQIPASAPAGYSVPAGLLPAGVDVSIPPALGDTLLSIGVTALGGSSSDFRMNLGATSLPLIDLATAPVPIVQGQPTLLRADAHTGAFATPAAGTAAINLPGSFSYTATKQDGSTIATLTCRLADGEVSKVGQMDLTKQGSKTTATAGAAKVKASKKPHVKVTVARSIGGIPTGKIVAKIGNKQVGTGTLKAGKVTLTLRKLKPGKYNVTVSYAGDGSTTPSAAKTSFKVVK